MISYYFSQRRFETVTKSPALFNFNYNYNCFIGFINRTILSDATKFPKTLPKSTKNYLYLVLANPNYIFLDKETVPLNFNFTVTSSSTLSTNYNSTPPIPCLFNSQFSRKLTTYTNKRQSCISYTCLPKIISRSMMAIKSKLTVSEVIAQKQIYSQIFLRIRKSPLNFDGLLSLMDLSHINSKVFQHIVSIMFPNALFPIDIVQRRYPDILIVATADMLSWNDVIASHYASIIKKHEFFRDGKLHVLVTPPYDPEKGDTSNNLQAIKNTGQKNPDYFFTYSFKDGKLSFTRYLDYKTGQYKPMSGHIVIKSNLKEFEVAVEQLMQQQKQVFNTLSDDLSDISKFIDNLLHNKSLDWVEKNTQLQKFYLSNMHRLFKGQTPSMLFYQEPAYEYAHMDPKKYSSISANTESCFSLHKTQNTILELFKNNYETAAKNYINSHGKCESLYKKLLPDYAEYFVELTHLS